ncbi:MAG: hypothetical protein GX219_10240 [Tissierellia bacterium]|nr:hypothetical protein [Tissierellia bacterium]
MREPKIEDMMNFLLVGKEADASTKKNVAVVVYRWYVTDVKDGKADTSSRRLIKEWSPASDTLERGFTKSKDNIFKRFIDGKAVFDIYPTPNIKPEINNFLNLEGADQGHDYLRIADFNGKKGQLDSATGNIFDFTPENLKKDLKDPSSSEYDGTAESDREVFRDFFDFSNGKTVLFSTTPVSDKGIWGAEKFAEFKLEKIIEGLSLDAWFDKALFADGKEYDPVMRDGDYTYQGVPEKLTMKYSVKEDGVETEDTYYIYIVWHGRYNNKETIQNEIIEWDKQKEVIKNKNKETNGVIDFSEGIKELKATIYLLEEKPNLEMSLDEIEKLCILKKPIDPLDDTTEEPEADSVVITALFDTKAYEASGRFTTDKARRLGDVWDLDHGDFYYPYSINRVDKIFFTPSLKDSFGKDFITSRTIDETHKIYYTNEDEEIDIETVEPNAIYPRNDYNSSKKISDNPIDVLNELGNPSHYKYIKVVSKYILYDLEGKKELSSVCTISFDKIRKIYYIKADYLKANQVRYMSTPTSIDINVYFMNENLKYNKWLIVKDFERNPGSNNNQKRRQSVYEEVTDLPGHYLLNYIKWQDAKNKNPNTIDFRKETGTVVRYYSENLKNFFYINGRVMDSAFNTRPLIRNWFPGKFLFSNGFIKTEIGDSFVTPIFTSRDNYRVFGEYREYKYPAKLAPIASRRYPSVSAQQVHEFTIERIDWRNIAEP